MKPRRETVAKITASSAECDGCTWKLCALNAAGLAAQHHDRTGHLVVVVTTTRLQYGNPDRAREASGQETLDL